MAPDLLFVYGTLRRDAGHPMHGELCELATYVGLARLPARLYHLGAYPGIVPAKNGAERVAGELYRLAEPSKALENLDRYEGCTSSDPEPHEFRRAVAQVQAPCGGSVSAWVYWYLGPLTQARLISHGDYVRALRDGLPGATL